MLIKWRLLLSAVALVLAAPPIYSATVYRTVDADGKVVYSDKPPANGKVQKTLTLTNGPTTPVPESVLKYQADLEKSMKQRLANAAAPASGTALLFTTKTCGYCVHAKAYLAEKRIPYQEHDIETPQGMQMFASVGGGRGVPVLVQNDKRVAGFSKTNYDAFFGQR